MKKYVRKFSKEEEESLRQMPLSDFLASYNKNMPAQFPRATSILLQKYKGEHPSFFKHGDSWSLDEHRKKIMDWLLRQYSSISRKETDL